MTTQKMTFDAAPSAPAGGTSVARTLLPLLVVVLVAFVVIGVAMPVLPLHVHDGLGFGPVIVGLVAGSQFVAALMARIWAGRTADLHGAKHAVIAGLAGATAAGLLYLVSLGFADAPPIAVSFLLAGRAVLGAAESFIITGATTWGLSRAGTQNAGKVIAWMGTAMFTAFAGGAPLGAALYDRGGFAAIAWATAIAPLVTVLLIIPLRGALPSHRGSASILSVMRQVWLPGLSAAFSSIGFGAVIAFSSLLFVAQSWQPVWLAFTAYAVALIIARILFGHLPDRIDGAKVALVCLLIETGGLLLIGLAPSAGLAAAGAALAGFGYALVFPGLGVEAVRRAPPERQGLAMGAYTACLDLALGISGPVLGMIANHAGFAAAFLVSALLVLCGVAAGVPLLRRNPQP
jgi:MFS family permease